jgi:hypothetical protein
MGSPGSWMGLVGLSMGFLLFYFLNRLTETGRATASVNVMINRDVGSEAVAKTACNRLG